MSRETFVIRDGELVAKGEAAPMLSAAPFIVRDSMDPTWHPANGKRYDSKAAFRRATRDAGCIEVGTESLTPRAPQPRMSNADRARDIKRSIDQIRSR